MKIHRSQVPTNEYTWFTVPHVLLISKDAHF